MAGIDYQVGLTEEAAMAELSGDARRAILLTATLPTGHKRRRFQADMAHQYCGGSARVAETTFRWGRAAVYTPNTRHPATVTAGRDTHPLEGIPWRSRKTNARWYAHSKDR